MSILYFFGFLGLCSAWESHLHIAGLFVDPWGAHFMILGVFYWQM
jgi:hypothetical protein